ncbi:hypothetical protein M153_15100016025 [Pseudoloma neurophilia]|uniref:Uncharacterized protein n=1 Tax=Pseudoloma neurophilia TaxID=146866 RepID=A0A0R0M3S8_9MICR|nr:hypothetical protein M153_15100016025 [Pseudoloma neurophilia]
MAFSVFIINFYQFKFYKRDFLSFLYCDKKIISEKKFILIE